MERYDVDSDVTNVLVSDPSVVCLDVSVDCVVTCSVQFTPMYPSRKVK